MASKNPLSGSLIKMKPSILAPTPTMPTIARDHLQPITEISKPVKDERAPPM